MVAPSKQHKAGRQKNNHHQPARRTGTNRLHPEPDLTLLRSSPKDKEEKEEDFPKEDEEPRPEDLAKEEEVLKAEEAEEAHAAAAGTDGHAEPRVRERSSYDGDTAIKLYLREIGQVKLLTPQEEIDLAARIKKGDKKPREQMIKANLRLVVKIARDYEGIGLPLLDLISEGNIGLMKAVERFDPAKGGKLSTYGSWWIKQSIKRALANQSKTIR